MKSRFISSFLGIACLLLAMPAARAADASEFDKIILRENPTKRDVEAYLKTLEKAVKNKKKDPITMGSLTFTVPTARSAEVTAKLAKVPPAHLGVVLAYAKSAHGDLLRRSFANAAVSTVIARRDLDDSSKEAVFASLPVYPGLVDVVLRQDWVKGSETRLLKLAKSSDPNFGHQYVELLAKIDTTDAREFLPELLLRGRALNMAYSFRTALSLDLSWFEPDVWVQKAWKKILIAPGRTPFDDPLNFAPIAARFGEKDALLMLAKKLNGQVHSVEKNANSDREAILALEQCIDSDTIDERALVKFVLDNRNALVFDKTSRKFKVDPSATAQKKSVN
jgi:hypothetical protein